MVATKIKQMFADEGAVSPVIGVILMVAVTVVLAAVIGAFVFGIGDSLGDPAPNTQIDFSLSDGVVDVAHDGGDTITGENTGALSLNIDSDDANVQSWDDGDTDLADLDDNEVYPVDEGESFTSGDNIAIVGEDGVDDRFGSGDSVALDWQSNDGGQSSTLGTYEAP